MAYLIDGNNVMGQTPGWHRDKRGARFRLLEQLAQFQRVKRVSITVVFDGAPEPNFPDGASYKGIRLHYPARGADADAWIKQYVEAHPNPRSLTVITSDKELIGYVRACAAQVVRSGQFRQQMEAALRESPPPEGTSEPDRDDLKGWLRYFGVGPEETDEDVEGENR